MFTTQLLRAGCMLLSIIGGPVVAGADAVTAPEVVTVPGGFFVAGSSQSERELGYRLDEKAYGHSVTRKNGWYDSERKSAKISLPSFWIMRDLVTNEDYSKFILDTRRPVPAISQKDWGAQGLIHPYKRVKRHLWRNGMFPTGRAKHPVVLANWEDASAYGQWLSRMTGQKWRLPTELEWEKAARGPGGNVFPWGNEWNPALLNSHDSGPFDTVAVGIFADGDSPYGMRDAAGQVFEWTATADGINRFRVKGGSWDDKGCGVCRPAARHSRPKTIRHILIGFRLVRDD